MFVESVLRYGLPVNFVCALIKPKPGSEDNLHNNLAVRLLVCYSAAPCFANTMLGTQLWRCDVAPLQTSFGSIDDGFGMDDLTGSSAFDAMALGGNNDAFGGGGDDHPYVFLDFVAET